MFAISDLIRGIECRSEGLLTSRCLGGAESMTVRTFAPLEAATTDTVAFLARSKFRDAAKNSGAGVLVLSEADCEAIYGNEDPDRAVVVTRNPYAWFAYALQVMTAHPAQQGGIAEGAHVHSSAKVDPTAIIDAGAAVGAGAVIGARTHLYPGSFVGEGTKVGEDSVLYANAVVYHGCRLGNRVIIHAGAVIGADGFGFVPFDGRWVKIPQIGGVSIGDDVEIGANTTIDRGALADTIIGRGSKLDNQIQLGHNCKLGEDSVMAACTGVAGSTSIGSHCVIGGAANINGHISIPDSSTVGPATNLMSWAEGEKVMMGFYPAMSHKAFERSAVMVMNLPKMRRQIKEIEAKLEDIIRKNEEKSE